MTIARAVLVLLALCPAGVAAPAAPEFVTALANAALDPSHARAVHGATVEAAGVRLTFADGWLVPAQPVGGTVFEYVFVGDATVHYEPPDAVERGQLDLFTRKAVLDEAVHELVLVPGRGLVLPAASEPAGELPKERLAASTQRFTAWLESAERKTGSASLLLLLQAAGDPVARNGWVVWAPDAAAGRLTLQLDPSRTEPLSIGAFVPASQDAAAVKERTAFIAKQQARGRDLDTDPKLWGTHDLWISTARATEPLPAPYRILRRTIALELDGKGVAHATARLECTADAAALPVVRFTLHDDLKLASITPHGAEPWPFVRRGRSIVALPPKPLAAGESFDVTLEYSGPVLDEGTSGLTFPLDETTSWYPGAPAEQASTFDVTFKFPKKYALAASGLRVEQGDDGDRHWERRTFETPITQFGFELGEFILLEARHGHVAARLAINNRSGIPDATRKELLRTIFHALEYLEHTFGPYPYDTLDIATVAERPASQAFPGFVTLHQDDLRKDRAALLATHELAHQWWGLVVAPESYREQWLMEGLAEFSSLMYGREQMYVGKRFRSPTAQYWDALVDGQTPRTLIRWLGPVVAGYRIDSSICHDCAPVIVYTKGTMVFDLLARQFGDEEFARDLARIATEHRGKTLSTAQLLAELEAAHSTKLTRFADEFIYGVGLPGVAFTYEYEPAEKGGWDVKVKLIEFPDVGASTRIIRLADGTFDLDRPSRLFGKFEGRLFLPYELTYYREDDRSAAGPDARKAEMEGNFARRGVIPINGMTGSAVLHVDYRPVRFKLDPDRSVPIIALDGGLHPKHMLRSRGVERLWSGDITAAEELLHQAIEAEVAPALRDIAEWEVNKELRTSVFQKLNRSVAGTTLTVSGRFDDGFAWVVLAEAALRRKDWDAADHALDKALACTDFRVEDESNRLRDRVTAQRLRLLLLSGDLKQAKYVLWKEFNDSNHWGEGWAAAAIAEFRLGNKQGAAKYMEKAKAGGINVDALAETLKQGG